MYYVGIDIAKYKQDCFIFTSEGEIVLESFTFENTREGFSKLKLILDALDHSQKIKTGLEATGIYGKNLKLFLSSIGYDFDELNPLQVKRFTNALSNRKTKTDKIDASQIARFVSTGASRTYVYSSYHTEALKQLTRARNSLIDERSKHQTVLTGILDVEFPEFKGFFNNKFTDTALYLLNKYKTVKRISKLSHNDCVLLHNKSRVISTSRFEELRESAKNTCGHHFDYNDSLISANLQIIKCLNNEIDKIEKEINSIMSTINSPVVSIPGISVIFAASIIGGFEDFSRFDNAKQLCAFCGVEPSIYQSGTSYHEGKMVKHGSSNLRRTLFNVVPYIIMHNETFKTFYDKKSSEGKAYRVAQSHVVKKLLRVIFTLEMTGSTFAPSKLY